MLAEAQESKEKFLTLINALHTGVILHGPHIEIQLGNPRALELLGLTESQLLGVTSFDPRWDVIHEDGSPFPGPTHPAPQAFMSGCPVREVVMGVFRPTHNDRIWLSVDAIPLLDPQGNVGQVVVNFVDITKRKHAEAAMRDAEWKFQALFEKGPIGVAYHEMIYDEAGNDFDYRFVDANEAYRELTGVDPRGKTVRQAFPGIELDPFNWIGTFGEVARTGKQLRFENYLQANDQWYDVVGYQYRPGCFVAAFLNITARKRAEAENARLASQLQQSQKMESVGRLAGGVAHDFNNMLGVILGQVELAMDDVPPDGALHDSLTEIRKAAVRSADLTRQLLAFARRQAVAPQLMDLNSTVAGMLKLLQRLIGENIRIRWLPDPDLWKIRMDPSQLDQVLANLCVNARDAIHGIGEVTLRTENSVLDRRWCETHEGAEPGEYVRLVVGDTGCGIEPVVIDHIFEPFFTTKGVGQGTGLGLATVYGIIKQNNGYIEVQSEPGKGTSFVILLPRYKGASGTTDHATPAGGPPRGTETILLVEDETGILDVGRKILERQGYIVLPATTPGEALGLAQQYGNKIDLLITDVVMPEMNGRELAAKLSEMLPHIKQIFMSGYTADVIAHQGVLDQGVHFLQKPFTVQDLSTKVRQILDS
jgi:signal transduction histidine kinase/CheY-like chemotaxis protein